MNKAEELCRQAICLAPELHSLRLLLTGILLEMGDDEGCGEQFEAAAGLVPEDEKPLVFVLKARLFLHCDRAEEALRVLDQARERYPQQVFNPDSNIV